MSSRSCSARPASLVASQPAIAPTTSKTAHTAMRRLRRLFGGFLGEEREEIRSASTTTTFGSELTNCPHCRQNCDPSGNLVPQLPQTGGVGAITNGESSAIAVTAPSPVELSAE